MGTGNVKNGGRRRFLPTRKLSTPTRSAAGHSAGKRKRVDRESKGIKKCSGCCQIKGSGHRCVLHPYGAPEEIGEHALCSSSFIEDCNYNVTLLLIFSVYLRCFDDENSLKDLPRRPLLSAGRSEAREPAVIRCRDDRTRHQNLVAMGKKRQLAQVER